MTLLEKEQEQIRGEEETKRKGGIIREYVPILLIAVFLSLFCSKVLIVNARIPSGSMEDTIHPGDRIIGFRLAYLREKPERQDIVLFRYPDDETQIFIKRIIGLPGDTVRIEDGEVYINDSEKPLKEPYLKETMEGSFGPYEVPEDAYFVMGDNRNNSLDSRYWENQYVEKEAILAKAMFQYYPNITKVE